MLEREANREIPDGTVRRHRGVLHRGVVRFAPCSASRWSRGTAAHAAADLRRRSRCCSRSGRSPASSGRMDEFVRLRSSRALSIAAAVTAGLITHLRLPRNRRLPASLSMFWVWRRHGPRLGRRSRCLRCLSRDEESGARIAHRARLEPGRTRRQARSVAPDRQRHRDRQVRPEPAARLRHREAVRQVRSKRSFSTEKSP